MEIFNGDFANREKEYIDDYVVSYLGLNKDKVEAKYGSTFKFVNNFLHSKVFNVDMDLYGKKARPFQNIIKGINGLIEAKRDVIVLTARDTNMLNKYIKNVKEEGIVAKTYNFIDEYVPNVKDVLVVKKTSDKKPYTKKAKVWIDDNYKPLTDELKENNVYVIKSLFPKNKDIEADFEISNRNLIHQPFVEAALEYTKKGDLIITDLDDTLTEFGGCWKDVCDHALTHYPDEFKELR